MSEAIQAYRHVAASSEFKEIERLKWRAGHDEAQAIRNAEQKGLVKGRVQERTQWLNLLKSGKTINEILSMLEQETGD